jgi:hypothetical protein
MDIILGDNRFSPINLLLFSLDVLICYWVKGGNGIQKYCEK